MTDQQRDILDSLVQIGRASIRDIASHTGIRKDAILYALSALVRDGFALTDKVGAKRFWIPTNYGRQAALAFRGESTTVEGHQTKELTALLDEENVPKFNGDLLIRVAFILGKAARS